MSHSTLFQISGFVKLIIERWQRFFKPGRNMAVDESMIAFKGRTGMMQYMPAKPHKWGLKAWCLADSKTGYMYNWELYTGKTDRPAGTSLVHDVVVKITRPIVNLGHVIFMDNFFSSPALYSTLADEQTGACGTLRINRRGVPQRVKTSKLKFGDLPLFERDDKLLFISWFDKRQITLLTTVHNTSTFTKNVRSKNIARRQITKPKAIELYSQHMGGVDRADQQLWYFLNLHRTTKWWKKVFFYLVEVCFQNSLMLWKLNHPGKKVVPCKYRLAVIEGLLSGRNARSGSRPGRNPTNPLGRLVERHIGNIMDKTKAGRQSSQDCVVCSDRTKGKRHQTKFECKQCKVAVCPVPCFERLHTLVDYKVLCTRELHGLP